MKFKKKREYRASELAKSLAKIYNFEEKLSALEIKNYLKSYLEVQFHKEINKVSLENGLLTLRIASPLLKNDFRMRKSFYLKQFQEIIGADKIVDIIVL